MNWHQTRKFHDKSPKIRRNGIGNAGLLNQVIVFACIHSFLTVEYIFFFYSKVASLWDTFFSTRFFAAISDLEFKQFLDEREHPVKPEIAPVEQRIKEIEDKERALIGRVLKLAVMLISCLHALGKA